MCDRLWNFGSQNEARWRLALPVLHCGCGRRAVERGVNFDGIERRGVISEVVGGLHNRGVERCFPTGSGEGRSTDAKLRHASNVRPLN